MEEKVKKPVYKKWWFWVIIVVLLIIVGSAATGGNSGNKTETQDESQTSEKGNKSDDENNPEVQVEEREKDKTTAVIIEEQVLLDQNGIKITAKELIQDSILGPAVKVLIENTTEQNVTVQVRNMSVNGIMAESIFSSDVAAQKSANDTITLMNTALEAAGITTIQNIEFSFHVFDTDNWNTIFDSESIYLATSADGTETQVIDDSGTKILEQDGVSITIKEVSSQESFWGTDIYVYIENNSGENITVQARSVSINGFMVEPMFSSDIVNGKKAFDSITFLESELEDNGIESIDEIENSLHVFNMENLETIFY